MAIRDRLIDLEQRLKRLAGEPAPTEPLEIRQAVLQAIVDLTRPAGRGRRLLPFDRIDVEILAPTVDGRRVFEAVLARDEGLEAAASRLLASAGCDVTSSCGIEVHYRKRRPPGWTPEQHFAVTGRAEAARDATAATAVAEAAPVAAPATAAVLPLVVLKVIKGQATKRSVELRAGRINIGRQEEVSDRDQRLVRRNQLVFVEGEPLSDTVSRAHAHVRCAPGGECRLRDDNSAYGTRVVRGGQTIDVVPTNTRGVRLQPGDEVHLGRAIVRFDVRT